jgi:hypothetical protein
MEKAVEQLEGLGYHKSDIKGRKYNRNSVVLFYLLLSSYWCSKPT